MLILYLGDLHFSGWSMRGRVAVREKQIPFEERFVELDWPSTETAEGVLMVGDLPEEREARIGCQCAFEDLRVLDSEGLLPGSVVEALPRVPVLVNAGTCTVAADVVSIAEYLDEIAPDSGTRLMGSTPAQRARIRSLCAWASHDLSSLINGASYAKSLRPRPPSLVEPCAAEQAHWVCDTVATLLHQHRGPYTVGEFSLVDVMLSPLFQQMTGWGIPIADSDVAEYAELLLERPSIRDHLDEAKAVYRAIADTEVGSPQWILRHYRYNRTQRLLHDWQTDICMQVSNATAELVITLAYAGGTVEEIATIVSTEFGVPQARVVFDVRNLLNRLDPRHENEAA